MCSVTMKFSYFLPLVFVILNGNVFDVTAHDHGVVDDLLNVILKLKKETTYTHPRKIPAFSAIVFKDVIPAMKEIIKFDSVRTNIGGHYSPNTGVFTVPRPGLYMLSATVRSTKGRDLHCALWVNDVMYEKAFGTNYTTGSLNTVLQLKKGDRVNIKKDSKYSWEDTGLCFPDHGIVDDLLNVILKLKKGTTFTNPRKIPAFTATLSKGFTPTMNEIIKFDSMRTNIGGHYSPNTWVFTVPRPGLYMLSATVRATSDKHLHCALWVNDVMYERLFGTKYSTGSLNTVLQLKKGDRVYIKKDSKYSNSAEHMLGTYYSMFSGYLIA